MRNFSHHNVEEIFDSAREIANKLSVCGKVDASREIVDTINSFWTTSSEALGEIRLTLLKLRPIVEKNTNFETTLLLDQTVQEADDLWNGKYISAACKVSNSII